MSVFISYNHKDEAFVERLGLALMEKNIPIWRDKWQMQLGDSITGKVEQALEKASFACIVLSKNSVQSDWVKREIAAALVRELDKNKLSILPLVIDDCKIPLFLRDKIFADFRNEFDSGVKMIVNAVSDKYNLYSGKITNTGITTSFGTDVLLYEKNIEINLDIISSDEEHDYHILTKVKILGNAEALEQFLLYKKDGEESKYIHEIISICADLDQLKEKRIVVGGKKTAIEKTSFKNDEFGLAFSLEIISKKVGADNGKFVILNLGSLFQFYSDIQ